MKAARKAMKGFSIFCFGVATSIILDMFVFKAYLKNLLVRANTSSYSPYSTDGQSNWVLILVLFGVGIMAYLIYTACAGGPESPDDKKNDKESGEGNLNSGGEERLKP